MSHMVDKNICKKKNILKLFPFGTFNALFFSIFVVIYHKNRVLKVPKGKTFKIKKCCKCSYLTYVTSQKNF